MNGKFEKIPHPGIFLKELLLTRKISQVELAHDIEMQPPHVSGLLNGKRHISATLALKLEKILGIDAMEFMQRQMRYDLQTARKRMRVRRRLS